MSHHVHDIATLGGDRPSVYGLPIRRGVMRETDGLLLVEENGGKRAPDFSIASRHHGPGNWVGGVTLYLPPMEAQRLEVHVVERQWDIESSAAIVPRRRWIEDIVGARVVDSDHGPLTWSVERIGPDDPDPKLENTPTHDGPAMTRWEAQGWLRNAKGEPIVLGWATITIWAHSPRTPHVYFHLRNQAPRGKKWGSRLIESIAFETFPGWTLEFDELWIAGYKQWGWTAPTTRLQVFQAESPDHPFIMAEADGLLVEFIPTYRDANADAAVPQPFAVLNAWDHFGWGYSDGAIPPPEATTGEPLPARLKPLYADRCYGIKANESWTADPSDIYELPRISSRAEDMWHHRAGAPHRNDMWDVPFLCRPSRETAGYVDDLVHYAKSFCELPHQTTILDPDTGKIVPWIFKWGDTKDEYSSGRPSIRRNANDPDEVSYENSPRRWMIWENPGSNMTLDREHADLACLEQAWLCTGQPAFRRFIESRHYMTGLEPDGAGVEPASSERMLAWYLQHHEVAARLSPDEGERKRRFEVGLQCLRTNLDKAGTVSEGEGNFVPAPTVGTKPLPVMFSHGNYSGCAPWMMAFEWQCGILPIMVAHAQWGASLKEIDVYREVLEATATLFAWKTAYYDGAGKLAGYLYKCHPHGEETIKRRGAVYWGEGKGPHGSGIVGEAYHPTEGRISLDGSMTWMAGFWGAIGRFLPETFMPRTRAIATEMARTHLEFLRDVKRKTSFHPYRASAWNLIRNPQRLAGAVDFPIANPADSGEGAGEE